MTIPTLIQNMPPIVTAFLAGAWWAKHPERRKMDTPSQAVQSLFSGIGRFFKQASLANAVSTASAAAPALEAVANIVEPGSGAVVETAVEIAKALTAPAAPADLHAAAPIFGLIAPGADHGAAPVAAAAPAAPEPAPALVLAPQPVAAPASVAAAPTLAGEIDEGLALLEELAKDFEALAPIAGRLFANFQKLGAN